MGRIALGCRREATQPECILAVLAEVILTFMFNFVGVGAAMAAERLEGGGSNSIMGQTALALAHGLMVVVLVAAGQHLSGALFNPAATLGLAVGGHITIVRSVLFIIAQLIGSSLACLLLKYVTGGTETPVHSLSSGVGAFQGVVLEMVLTFTLLFTVYATLVDPKKMVPKGLGPMFVGFVTAANILAGGAFTSASMNPARSFGPALASWNWTDHWVYWVGPVIGGLLAGLVYENVFAIKSDHEPNPSENHGV